MKKSFKNAFKTICFDNPGTVEKKKSYLFLFSLLYIFLIQYTECLDSSYPYDKIRYDKIR